MESRSVARVPQANRAHSPTWFARVALRLAIAISLFMLLLGFGELVAYLRLRPSAEETGFVHTQSIYRDKWWAPVLWRERLEASSRLRYYAYVLWRKAPFSGKTVNIDEQGLRLTYHSQCDGPAYRIWMFGNSGLWGDGSPDWATIPSLLAEQYESAGRKACVRNYGELGRVSTQEMIELTLALKHSAQHPDLVIFYDGVSDMFLPLESDQPDVHVGFETMKYTFEDRSREQREPFGYLRKTYTYRALSLMSTALAARPSGKRFSAADNAARAKQILDNYLQNVAIVRSLAQHYGLHCLFVWQPTILSGRKPLSTEEEEMRVYEEKVRPGAEALFRASYDQFDKVQEPDFLNLADLFQDHSETVFADFSHLGPEGNRIAAQRIYEALRQRGR